MAVLPNVVADEVARDVRGNTESGKLGSARNGMDGGGQWLRDAGCGGPEDGRGLTTCAALGT
jgi:hypothetical protein